MTVTSKQLAERIKLYHVLRERLNRICALSRDGLARYQDYLATPDAWTCAPNGKYWGGTQDKPGLYIPWSKDDYALWGGMKSALVADWEPNLPKSALERLAEVAE